jgi:DHA2 family multidrug resistance protein
MVTTIWANQTTRNHAELVGLADRDQSVRTMMEQGGMTPDAASQAIDYLITSQSGMLSTNQVMMGVAVMFIVAATIIWLAPKPTRTIEPGAGGH